MRLWYNKPASIFEEALPIGNGKLGAMVYGGIRQEKIALNEDTLWSGYPQDKSNIESQDYLPVARKLIEEGKKYEAQEVIWQHMTSTWTQSYIPAGNLILEMQHEDAITDYVRELDLDTAIVTTTYTVDGVTYTREIFVSHPDNAIFLRIAASQPGRLNLAAYLESQNPVLIKNIDNEYMCMCGKAPACVEPNYSENEDSIIYEENGQCGLAYEVIATPQAKGGTIIMTDKEIIIKGSDEVVFLITAATNYQDSFTAPKDSTIKEDELCMNTLESIADKSNYDRHKQCHIEDYASLYHRVFFKLNTSDNGKQLLPTNDRLKAYLTDKSDIELPVLLFNYGRYLLIASSREGSQAANLQGIWNESMRPPWSSNYTTNINAQMNYWLAQSCNLSECHMPLLNLTKELVEPGSRTAANNYGCKGWCAHHNIDLWRQTEPVGKLAAENSCTSYAFWPHGGNWLAHHIWEHYEYTQEVEFLKEYKAVLKGAGEFILDWAYERDGVAVLSPSISPENAYIENGRQLSICENSTMDIGIAHDVLDICMKMCDILEEEPQFKESCKALKGKLPDYQVGSLGQLIEWDKEYDEAEQYHRHLSLLYGFHPGNSMNHQDTPELIDAIKTSMIRRSDVATGWGIAWKINIWARLRDGDHSKLVLDNMLHYVDKTTQDESGGVYSNLLCAHPPFQIDGNFGATAGIAEMLLQSQEGYLHLLPALPSQWQEGEIKGLCGRGGFIVDIAWEDDLMVKAGIQAKYANKAHIVYADKSWDVELKAGEKVWIS